MRRLLYDIEDRFDALALQKSGTLLSRLCLSISRGAALVGDTLSALDPRIPKR